MIIEHIVSVVSDGDTVTAIVPHFVQRRLSNIPAQIAFSATITCHEQLPKTLMDCANTRYGEGWHAIDNCMIFAARPHLEGRR